MSRRRSVLLGLIAWVLVVLTCATGVWFIIDQAGNDLLAPAPIAQGARGTPSDSPGTTSSTETPSSSTPPTSQTPTTSASSPTAVQSVQGPASTTTPSRPRWTGTTPPVALPPVPPSPAPPQTANPPTSTSGALAVNGGRVGATCTGNQISLAFATPESGWSFTVETDPDHVGVHFVSTNGNGESSVTARCSNGTPVFNSSEAGDGGGG